MHLYTVHVRRDGLDPDRDIVMLKEGFSWPAGMLGIAWALCHGLWWTALALVVVFSGGIVLLNQLGAGGEAILLVTLGIAVIMGYIGNDLRRVALERDGFKQSEVVTGADMLGAHRRFFDRNAGLASGIAQGL